MTASSTTRRAENHEELVPLIKLCKAGRLFDVQDWIGQGHPVNPPPPAEYGHPWTPLEVAIDQGFHSLVQVLLEGGALQEPVGVFSPMNRVLRARRMDMIELLVAHGFDPRAVDMDEVFATWDRRIMEYFIERGADIKSGYPFAVAFCERIRTALGVYMRCRERDPELQEQVNIALRYHCSEGNKKWMSLMLWAGADPYARGTHEPWEELTEEEEDEAMCALGWAAMTEHYAIFKMKPVRTRPPGPGAQQILRYLITDDGVAVLKKWLEAGVDPNDQENGGCFTIRVCLSAMSWSCRHYVCGRDIDCDWSRDKIKSIHLLARQGAKWIPTDDREIAEARHSLLRMIPDYTVEFVWIMWKYRACRRAAVEELLRTSTIRSHTVPYRDRLREILASWE